MSQRTKRGPKEHRKDQRRTSFSWKNKKNDLEGNMPIIYNH